MRGSTTKHTAVVVDLDGVEHYRIVSTTWVKITIVGFVLMLVLMILLALLMLFNRYEIDSIRDKIHVEDNGATNTQNPL